MAVSDTPCDAWAKAGRAAEFGNVLVVAGEPMIGPAPVEELGERTTSNESLLAIPIVIRNTSDSRKLAYAGWRARHGFSGHVPTLGDDLGNTYKRVYFGALPRVVGQLAGGASIAPGQQVVDWLLFQVPVQAASYLKLTLPAEAVGAEGDILIKVAIPRPNEAA